MGIEKLDKIMKEIIGYLDEKDKSRENLIKLAREVVRLSREIISIIHKGNIEMAMSKLKELSIWKDVLLKEADKYPDLRYGGVVLNSLTEYVEVQLLLSLIRDKDVLSPEELGVDCVSYLLGLADVIGELRRLALDSLREDKIDLAEEYIGYMEDIYVRLSSLSYPDAMIPGLRRKCDIARRLIDETKSDLLFTRRSVELARMLGIRA